MNKITNSMVKIKTKVAEKKATAKEVLNNKGAAHTMEVMGWIVLVLLIVAIVLGAIKLFLPDFVSDIFAKFTEMLGSWTIPTT